MERKLGQIQVGEKKITTVAFEAIKTENQGGPGCSSSYLCNQGPITFTTVRINLGHGFHDNGTFIAPTDGIYHFEVSIIAERKAQLVMKTTPSNQMFRLYDRKYSSGWYERTITRTATLKMVKGDGIYVENESSDTNSVRADTTYPLTFKGFKIN